MKFKNILLTLLIFSIFILSGCSIKINKKSYTVGNEYFTYLGYEKTNVIEDNKINIGLRFECEYNLYSLAIKAQFINNNSVIHNIDKNLNFEYESNKENVIYLEVDYNNVFTNFDNIIVSFSGQTYDKIEKHKEITKTDSAYNPQTEYIITLKYNLNSIPDTTLAVKKGEKINYLTIPTSTNRIFVGWYSDEDLTNIYDTRNGIPNKNLTLFAKWEFDYKTIENVLTNKTLKSSLKIYNKQFNTFLGFTTKSKTNVGSGIIFKKVDSTYYALTNNHVTYFDNKYDNQKITVEDYLGNKYHAKLINGSAEYDLAIVSFTSKKSLFVTSLATNNPEINESVISMSHPKGKDTSIAYGKILQYETVSMNSKKSYESNVTFPVMIHDAETAKGSSGGAILDIHLNLVGIHFAGSVNQTGEFLYGAAIQIEKVHEFINLSLN